MTVTEQLAHDLINKLTTATLCICHGDTPRAQQAVREASGIAIQLRQWVMVMEEKDKAS